MGKWIPCGTLNVELAAFATRTPAVVLPEAVPPVPPDTPPVPVEGSGTIEPPGVVEPGAGAEDLEVEAMWDDLSVVEEQSATVLHSVQAQKDGLLLLSVYLYAQNTNVTCLHVACQ